MSLLQPEEFGIDCMDMNGGRTIYVRGELGPMTAPLLGRTIANVEYDVERLVIDVSDVTYLCGAGVQVFLLGFYQMIGRGSEFIVRGAAGTVRDQLEAAGLEDCLAFL